MKDTGSVLLWLACAAALVLAGWRITQKQWVSAAFLLLLGIGVLATHIWVLRSLHRLDLLAAAGGPDDGLGGTGGPIVMQWSAQESGKTGLWAFGYLVVAIALALNPGTDWKRFLFYGGIVILLGVTIFMLVLARDKKVDRIVADSNGVEIRNRMLDGGPTGAKTPALDREESEEDWEFRHETKIAWSEVGAVKMVRVYRRKYRPRGAGSNREFVGRELVFYSRDGKAMMRLHDPLEPPQAYRTFLEAIPHWTGLTIGEGEKRD